MSILSAITRDKVIANQLIEGGVSGVIFENFLYKALTDMRSSPEYENKEIVLLMDNARIHKHPLVLKTLRDLGIKVIFNSEYSPWLNPIEQLFSFIKRKLKKEHILRR